MINFKLLILTLSLSYSSSSFTGSFGKEQSATPQNNAQDCCGVQLNTGANLNGVYNIYPFEKEPNRPIQVYCDFKTDGGGWTVFQRREELKGPTQKFYQNWDTYETGFGLLQYSHWLGLSNIASLTSGCDQTLRVELIDWEGEFRYATYDTFHIGDKSTKYKLTLGNYNGTAGDSMGGNGMVFSTFDIDHDTFPQSCAQKYRGAWWYDACHSANLNGVYGTNGSHPTSAIGVVWQGWHGQNYGLKRAEMKMRNINFPNGCRLNPESTSSVEVTRVIVNNSKPVLTNNPIIDLPNLLTGGLLKV